MAKNADQKETYQNITILRATENDSKDIWEWRNDELTKKMSVLTDSIHWETHSAWYKKTLANPNCYLYIGYVNNEKIGMCRFDIDPKNNISEVSININPTHRGKKLSSPLLSKTITTFLRQHHAVDLIATIKKINIGSIQCFTKSGFIFEREEGEYNYYKRLTRII
jgi:RimJ/RimL family protein N-acetyltransferase